MEYSEKVKKPLLVIGGAYGNNPLRHWFNIPAHGQGDICLDIDESACKGAKVILLQDVREQLPFPNNYFGATYSSHILEHLPNKQEATKVINELNRVSDRVWIVTPKKYSLWAWIVPDHHLWISQKNKEIIIEERR